MTEGTRQLSDRVMPLHPNVGFMSLPTTLKITVSWRDHSQAYQSLSGSWSCLVHAPTTNNTDPWSVTGDASTSFLSPRWSTSDQKQLKHTKGREKHKEGIAETGRVLAGTSTVLRKTHHLKSFESGMRSSQAVSPLSGFTAKSRQGLFFCRSRHPKRMFTPRMV